MVLNVTVIFFAILIYTFVFWYRLKEDYEKEKVFSASIYALLGIGVFLVLSKYIFSQWWFWMTLAGSFLGLLIAISKFILKFTETIEAWVVANLFLIEATLLLAWIRSGDVKMGILFMINSVLILVFFLIDRYYKRFSWYKSGKVGFSGFMILGLFFSARSVIAFVFSDVISFVGMEDIYLSAAVAFGSFLAIFNLSRSTI